MLALQPNRKKRTEKQNVQESRRVSPIDANSIYGTLPRGAEGRSGKGGKSARQGQGDLRSIPERRAGGRQHRVLASRNRQRQRINKIPCRLHLCEPGQTKALLALFLQKMAMY